MRVLWGKTSYKPLLVYPSNLSKSIISNYKGNKLVIVGPVIDNVEITTVDMYDEARNEIIKGVICSNIFSDSRKCNLKILDVSHENEILVKNGWKMYDFHITNTCSVVEFWHKI